MDQGSKWKHLASITEGQGRRGSRSASSIMVNREEVKHHGQEPKYLKQLKNDKESVGFLMVLMREPAGACPGHVQKGRPTPQALITEPAGSGPWTMVCTRRQADTSGIDNRVGRIRTKSRPDQDHVVYKQAGRYFRH
ncbi:hypothetical protein DEU56DRAFT_757885 [Suillus clintonianus]|uniref:uncharacterized protein n=1 Tax=Suillus clintonianus TaxID=1904413 RepID=UPI001B87A934|nr:uncharacterized protein DEU56DRAFT_757885 [Suillus clintonianus]KAG2130401.1 hypothetical protein DEU56DRAFT_757885 [Suillus clintonianus]